MFHISIFTNYVYFMVISTERKCPLLLGCVLTVSPQTVPIPQRVHELLLSDKSNCQHIRSGPVKKLADTKQEVMSEASCSSACPSVGHSGRSPVVGRRPRSTPSNLLLWSVDSQVSHNAERERAPVLVIGQTL